MEGDASLSTDREWHGNEFLRKGFRNLSLSCDNVKPHSFSNKKRRVMGIGKKLSFESWSGVFAKAVSLSHGKGRGKRLHPMGIVVQYCFSFLTATPE